MNEFIYWLERNYGTKGQISHSEGSQINPLSGDEEIINGQLIVIPRMVLLPVSFAQNYASSMRDSSFPYGAWFAQGGSIIVVRHSVLPLELQTQPDKFIGDTIILNDRNYEIHKVQYLHKEKLLEFAVQNLAGNTV